MISFNVDVFTRAHPVGILTVTYAHLKYRRKRD